ncbi:hypothetical protein LEL_00505 [Akanthomyces lecanii RCEF 1005]|uniref:DNA2/NAM7 helicase-like C-terminal domain-containing protein n=1 Tax=Akanthomyces lecanii RCEF 1005 TaxID=1081108 RepID=A0A168JWM8_CORDF|nr:hypothetical protein LEL_00505 [Akanthomyces lecanii RCEF 1005]
MPPSDQARPSRAATSSVPSKTTRPSASADAIAGRKSTSDRCAVFHGRSGALVAGTKNLAKSKVEGRYKIITIQDRDPHIGFTLGFPLPGNFQQANHQSGHGVQYTLHSQTEDAVLASVYVISVRFPRDLTVDIREIAPKQITDLVGHNPAHSRPMTLISVHLGSQAIVTGFGIPYANPGEPDVEGWINDQKPMPGGHTMAEFLAQREFTILLDLPVERTIQKYGYGDLPPVFKYPYPHDLAWEIDDYKSMDREHRGHPWITPFDYRDVSEFLTVQNHATYQDMMWISDAVNEIREIKIPAYFAILDSARQNFDGAKTFYVILATEKHQLSTFEAAWHRLTKSEETFKLQFNDDKPGGKPKAAEKLLKPILWACELVMNRNSIADLNHFHPTESHELGPGTGKTTCISAVVVAMRSTQGRVLASTPTNVATDNFARRINERTRAIAQRCRELQLVDIKDYCPLLVVRGHNVKCEVRALLALLQDPSLGDDASKYGQFETSSRWKKHLSPAYWALSVLGSSAGETLLQDSNSCLLQLQGQVAQTPRWALMRAVVNGQIRYQDAVSNSNLGEPDATSLLHAVVDSADVLCCTPAGFENNRLYRTWRDTVATCVAIDEAASMRIPDFLGVCGNCALPCALAGDPQQLPPAVFTKTETLEDGSFINRFAAAGKVSPLMYFMTMGLPVYRLDQQLRMGTGLFDMMSGIIYPEVPLSYAKGCEISQPKFKIGRDLEAFFRNKFPALRSPPPGKLLPVFVHCDGCPISTADILTWSLRNPAQVEVALDLAVEFVKVCRVDTKLITFIAPYAANVDEITTALKNPAYAALRGMPAPATIDSFQGHENEIVFVVMGTTGPTPGPGFTADAKRLNVMLTRHRCGLVIVGDLYITDNSRGYTKGKAAKGQRQARNSRILVIDAEGNTTQTKAAALKTVHMAMLGSGRSATAPVQK